LYKVFKVLGIGNSMLLRIHVPKYDYKFYCRINNREDLVFMTNHEEDIIEHFTPKEGDIVVDIGAHMGRYTIISSKRVGANGKVVAIEAHPGNFEMLKSNIKLNQLTNVIPLNYAAYSKETKIKLYVPDEESGYTIYHTLMERTGKKFVEIDAITLDYLLLQLNVISGVGVEEEAVEVNWIKIDVEGAEFEVLKGASNVLSKSKDIALLMEVHGLNNYRPVVEFLSSYNFKIEFEVLKGASNVLSKSKDIALLMEVHGLNNYRPVVEFLSSYNFKIEFEKTYETGDKHIILRKYGSTIE
jgi:FkbM family methyltransferase